MKKRTLCGARILAALSVLGTLVFIGCENEEAPVTKPDARVSLQQIDVPDATSLTETVNGRSNYSTKVIMGIDWTGQYPYFEMGTATSGGGAGYSFGNTIPSNSTTACTTVGDFNGDGVDEYIIGYNSPSGPFLIKNTGPYLLSNTTQFYTGSTYWTLAGVAAVDFDGNGTDELITALNSPNGPALYIGNATSIGYAKIYQGPSSMSIVAVAGGNFSGNGHEELISAFNSTSGPSLYRSQGNGVGSSFYQGSTFWTLAALTAADFDNNGSDELITGLNSVNGPALYKGNATTIGYVKLYQGTPSTGKLVALTSGKFGSTCMMHVGFYHTTSGSTLHNHDGTNFISLIRTWSTNDYVLKTLASGDFRFQWE